MAIDLMDDNSHGKPIVLYCDVFSHAQGQRTVYRLTLVKAWNTEEIQAYADLVAMGNPDFIEIKVTMQDV